MMKAVKVYVATHLLDAAPVELCIAI